MSETDTSTKEKIRVKQNLSPPPMFNVLYVNDDVTTMEFVVESLINVFGHTDASARQITVRIHEQGAAVVATLPYEIAEQKGVEVTILARNAGFPLQIKLEIA